MCQNENVFFFLRIFRSHSIQTHAHTRCHSSSCWVSILFLGFPWLCCVCMVSSVYEYAWQKFTERPCVNVSETQSLDWCERERARARIFFGSAHSLLSTINAYIALIGRCMNTSSIRMHGNRYVCECWRCCSPEQIVHFYNVTCRLRRTAVVGR